MATSSTSYTQRADTSQRQVRIERMLRLERRRQNERLKEIKAYLRKSLAIKVFCYLAVGVAAAALLGVAVGA